MSDETVSIPPYSTIFPTLILPDDEVSLGETIAPRADFRTTISDLPKIHLGPSGAGTEYTIITELGRGGMGVVQLASQNALGRDVAIKSVTRDLPEAHEALLREGRIMGIVEHPNVVPVHAVGTSPEGHPVIVMKRVVGREWEELLDEVHADPVGRDVQILIQVCRALDYSHSLGIIHRDIKPSNVMVGEFGEVYLVDWGLAVSLDERFANIPQKKDANEVVGTPAFMAPEMTTGDGEKLGTFTDVYLLGAMLYYLVTGKPPHPGKTLFDALRASYEGRPRTYSDEIGAELIEICEQAMAREPEERFESVRAFQNALEKYLTIRGSAEMARRASEQILTLRHEIEEDKPDEQIYATMGAIRFTLENALEVWPENHEAEESLHKTLAMTARYELDRGNPDAAARLAVGLPKSDADLSAEIATAKERAEKEIKGLKELEYDIDPDVSTKQQGILALWLAATFIVLIWYPEMTAWLGWDPALIHFMGPFWVIPGLLLATVWSGALRANFANRVIIKAVWAMMIATVIVRLMVVDGALTIRLSMVLEMIMIAACLGILSLGISRRFSVSVPCYMLGAGAVYYGVDPYVGFGITAATAAFSFAVATRVSTETLTKII